MKLDRLRALFRPAPASARERLEVEARTPAVGKTLVEALGVPAICAHCKATEGVEWESSRTAYPEDPAGMDDPNAPIPLCRACAKEHHEHWDEQWDNYRSGLL